MAANPYVQGWREWDERYADLVIGKRNWQIAAGGAADLGPDSGRRHGVAVGPQQIHRLHRLRSTGSVMR